MQIKKDKRGTFWLSAGGKRVSVNLMAGPWIEGIDPALIKVRPKALSFPAEIKAALEVSNSSDMMIDYFEKDNINLLPGHALHASALEALK